jgi:hypothetical protein
MKVGILAFITITIAVITSFITVKSKPVTPTASKISKIEHFYFTYSNGYAMNAYTKYQIDKKDGKYIATIKQHGEPEDDAKEIEISSNKMQELESILNKYKVNEWNGFNKTDKNVLDGDSFSFSLRTEEGNSISASGYMKWPENYKSVVGELETFFGEIIKE